MKKEKEKTHHWADVKQPARVLLISSCAKKFKLIYYYCKDLPANGDRETRRLVIVILKCFNMDNREAKFPNF